jgi:hypothetical protein
MVFREFVEMLRLDDNNYGGWKILVVAIFQSFLRLTNLVKDCHENFTSFPQASRALFAKEKVAKLFDDFLKFILNSAGIKRTKKFSPRYKHNQYEGIEIMENENYLIELIAFSFCSLYSPAAALAFRRGKSANFKF